MKLSDWARKEKIWNIGYRHGRSRKLSSWTNTLIRDRLMDRCERLGVRVVHQSSAYRSQRCNACGLVRKSSRKGKEYGCPNCGSHMDADLNAAMNHETALPDIPWNLRKLNLNRKGFFWTEEEFINRLVPIMKDNFKRVWDYAEEHGVTMRRAAFLVAIKRVADALKIKGFFL